MDVLVACPGRAHPIPVRAFWREKSLASRRVAKSHPFAGEARSHSPLPQPAPTRSALLKAFSTARPHKALPSPGLVYK